MTTTDTHIVEGNNLIAEFMGGKWHSNFACYLFDISPTKHAWTELQYHSSWDWIMPACNKWDNLNLRRNEMYFTLCDLLDGETTSYIIEPVFNQLIENIQWYNSQSK